MLFRFRPALAVLIVLCVILPLMGPTGAHAWENHATQIQYPAVPKLTVTSDVKAGPRRSGAGNFYVSGDLETLVKLLRAPQTASPAPTSIGRDTKPRDLTSAFLAVTAPQTIIVLAAWLIFLVILRRNLRLLWDRDVDGDAYASAAIICTTIYTTGQVVKAMVS